MNSLQVRLEAAREEAHGGETVLLRGVRLRHRGPQLLPAAQDAALRGAALQLPLLPLHLHTEHHLQDPPEDQARHRGRVQHSVSVQQMCFQDFEGKYLFEPRVSTRSTGKFKLIHADMLKRKYH